MRLCRFDDNRLGLVGGDEIADVSAALDALPACRWPFPPGDLLIRHLAAVREAAQAARKDARRRRVGEVRLHSPVANPSKVIAAPLNYGKHVEESRADAAIHHHTHTLDFAGFATPVDKLGLFLKASTSLAGAGDAVPIIFPDRRTDHELELAVVIGAGGRNIPAAQAFDHIAGYCIGLDMTVRGPEERSFRKSPDGYTVLGPWLVTPDEIGDPSALDYRLEVNGKLRQEGNTRNLTVGIARLVEIASRWYSLHPGDVIMTGTPEGVGPVAPGDVMTCWIENIGTMRVGVRGT